MMLFKAKFQKSERLAFLGVMLVGALGFGAEMESRQNWEEVGQRSSENEVTAAVLMQNFDYNESVMNVRGPLIGMGAQLTHFMDESFALQVNAEAMTGRTVYTGSTWDGAPATSENQFVIAEVSTHLLRKLQWSPEFSIAPLVGLGIRYTFQDKESRGDYRREYDYVYAGAGMQAIFLLKERTSLLLKVEYDVLVQGANKTYLSDATKYSDVTMAFNSGSAWKLTAEYNFLLEEGKPLQLLLSYADWNIAQSQLSFVSANRYVYEPSNQTYVTGLSLGYTFR